MLLQELSKLKEEAKAHFFNVLPRLDDGETTLHQEQFLTSGKYILKMQSDGNLVIYKGHSALWATGTNGHGNPPYRLVMQPDNNAVIYGNGAFQVVWTTHTNEHGVKPARLVLHNDANLVMYDFNNHVLWHR